ncbi:hypothetical protein DGWBC_0984 [Dehalogenimonas sp. WBC-2]|nr:hypothetical protein DGWBC_0984 [Dehalogenimonas sp. WBC-2]
MSEELGKIERPEAAAFSGKRKLYLVPLLYRWPEAPVEYNNLFTTYWQEIENQLRHLEDRIGKISHVYHEGVDKTGDEAIHQLEQFDTPSLDITKRAISAGAALNPIEDNSLLAESMDWERFVMLGFASQKVAKTATDALMSVMKSRYELITRRISESLKPGEAGVLFVREGLPIQFPGEIEVFSVFPPSLDAIHRYLRDRPQGTDEPAESEKPVKKTRTRKKSTPKQSESATGI